MTRYFPLPHVFALDNLEWMKEIIEGGGFNAVSSIVIEHVESGHALRLCGVPSSRDQSKALKAVQEASLSKIHITRKHRRESKSLGNVVFLYPYYRL